jgi:hypothetical protein
MGGRAADNWFMNSEPNQKPKKLSAAASVVAQARTKNQSTQKVVSLEINRVERRVDKNGKTSLLAIFPTQGKSPLATVDLSFLSRYPKLEPMFADAFLVHNAKHTPRTRIVSAGILRRGFFKYLQSKYSPDLNPEDIDDMLLSGFRQFLLTNNGVQNKRRHPNTVRKELGHVRATLSSLRTGPWATVARLIAERVPSGPIGAQRRGEPTEVLSMDALLSVMDAAEKEVLSLIKHLEQREILLAEGRLLIANGILDYRLLPVCLAQIEAEWNGFLPGHEVIKAFDPKFAYAEREIHGFAKLSSFFSPTLRDLVPFVLLLAVSTVFNPDTIRGLRWENIELEAERGGMRAIKIYGEKARAGKNLVRLLDPDAAAAGELSLLTLLESLRAVTKTLRPHARHEDADQIFIYAPTAGKRSIASLRVSDTSSPWGAALTAFSKENALTPFVLKQIRPTILDLVHFFGTLEDARSVGDHRHPSTTWTYYTSSTVKKRYRERIGEILLLRERWIFSHGKIDPRRLLPSDDKGAATPGFLCVDPYDSPRPNQMPGRLCTDYGGCPNCPLAAARPNDPSAVSFYSALQNAIFESQLGMSAHTWLNRWVPVLADLNALMQHVSPEVLEQSRRIIIRLPKVG